jgi:nicotinamide phosphoribosyltransferase
MVHSVLNTKITMQMIDEAELHANKMGLIFPRKLWEGIVKDLNGYVPLLVESLPEGVWCPKGTPFAQVRNTVKGYGEMVTWFEGVFLQSSFSSGCATEAFHMRRYLEEVKEEKGFDDSFYNHIHSFGFRGHRSLEDAYWAGTAWNLFLNGTDDFHTMQHTPDAKMGSISALAHKVTQQFDNEYAGYIHTISATADAGESIVAIVIDTYDADRFIDKYIIPLADYAKKKDVHLVLRPDSGDVLEQVVSIYKVVSRNNIDNVTALIGEGMSYQNIRRYDLFFKMRRVPLTFINYGVGGGFYNDIDRDTLGFAMKTAFSNGMPRMKFGMNPLKRSIPDKVVVFENEDGNLEAERERVWVTSDGMVNLYEKIYQYDYRFNSPYVKLADWNLTQDRAMQYVKEKNLQEHIVLSNSINELVKGFEEIYG